MYKDIIKTLVLVIIGFSVGYGLGELIKADQRKKEKVEIKMTLDRFTHRYTELTLELNSKTVKLDTAVTANKQTVDNLINEYIIQTHTLYEEIYQFTKNEELLTKDIKTYERAYSLLGNIYKSQQEAYNSMYSIFSKAGIASTIFVIESKQNLEMSNELTMVTCEDILRVDPGNRQAIETLNKLK